MLMYECVVSVACYRHIVATHPQLDVPTLPNRACILNHELNQARPWSVVSVDQINGVPQCGDYDAILTVVCLRTKMVHVLPCAATMTAADLSTIFEKHILCLHAIPDQVISDRGPHSVATLESVFVFSSVLRQSLPHSTTCTSIHSLQC